MGFDGSVTLGPLISPSSLNKHYFSILMVVLESEEHFTPFWLKKFHTTEKLVLFKKAQTVVDPEICLRGVQ